MSKRTWHRGPPPHVGWWEARAVGYESHCLWGWWDGYGWSSFASDTLSARDAGECASQKGHIYDGPGVQWSDYYPKNARVPRIKP